MMPIMRIEPITMIGITLSISCRSPEAMIGTQDHTDLTCGYIKISHRLHDRHLIGNTKLICCRSCPAHMIGIMSTWGLTCGYVPRSRSAHKIGNTTLADLPRGLTGGAPPRGGPVTHGGERHECRTKIITIKITTTEERS